MLNRFGDYGFPYNVNPYNDEPGYWEVDYKNDPLELKYGDITERELDQMNEQIRVAWEGPDLDFQPIQNLVVDVIMNRQDTKVSYGANCFPVEEKSYYRTHGYDKSHKRNFRKYRRELQQFRDQAEEAWLELVEEWARFCVNQRHAQILFWEDYMTPEEHEQMRWDNELRELEELEGERRNHLYAAERKWQQDWEKFCLAKVAAD